MEPITATVLISLLFSEAVKESGKALGKGAAETFTKLINTIKEKLKTEGTEGLLTRVQNQPTEANKNQLKDELQTQIDGDSKFSQELKQLVEELKKQAPTVQTMLSNLELSGNLKAGDATQEATPGGSVEQKMVTDIKADSIELGNLNQKA